jgi:uncharacterized protein YbcV (DUF1398 family)
MFTIEQIKQVHSKVKSGADFPAYIHELKQLGVTFYVTSVADGHTDYFGEENYKTSSPAKYTRMTIEDDCKPEPFKLDLSAHQQGKTDYLTFCNDCARSGIEKWHVCLSKMTCTYFDKSGNKILVEQIPD